MQITSFIIWAAAFLAAHILVSQAIRGGGQTADFIVCFILSAMIFVVTGLFFIVAGPDLPIKESAPTARNLAVTLFWTPHLVGVALFCRVGILNDLDDARERERQKLIAKEEAAKKDQTGKESRS